RQSTTCRSPTSASRARRFQNKLDPCWEEELKDYDLQNLMPTWLSNVLTKENPHCGFDLSVIVRMLFSCLVDADYKETERYYAAIRRKRTSDCGKSGRSPAGTRIETGR